MGSPILVRYNLYIGTDTWSFQMYLIFYRIAYYPMNHMMTSSNGNIFLVTGPLWGEFTGHRWIPLTKASDAELWCFLSSVPELRLSKQSWGWWFETPSCSLLRHRDESCFLAAACFGPWEHGPQHGFARIRRWTVKQQPTKVCTLSIRWIYNVIRVPLLRYNDAMTSLWRENDVSPTFSSTTNTTWFWMNCIIFVWIWFSLSIICKLQASCGRFCGLKESRASLNVFFTELP